MLNRLHKTTNGSANRQLYILMYELKISNDITAKDVNARMDDIMLGACRNIKLLLKFLVN